MVNPLIPKKDNSKSKFVDVPHSAGILDDFAVRKNVATKEGTIEKVPTADKDIANKEYVDDVFASIDLSGYVPYNGATGDVYLGGNFLSANAVYSSTITSAGTKFVLMQDGGFRVTNSNGEVPVHYDWLWPYDTGGSTYDQTTWMSIPNTVYDPVGYTGGMQFYNNGYGTLFGGIDGTTGTFNWELDVNLKGNSNIDIAKLGTNALVTAYGITDGFGIGAVYDGYNDGYGRGAGVFSTRGDLDNELFVLFCGYDWDTGYTGYTDEPLKQVYFGGTLWAHYNDYTGGPDANDLLFWTDDGYNEDGSATNVNFRILHDKLWIGKAGQLTTPYYGTYARPRYKLDIGDGDTRIRGSDKLLFGGDKDTNADVNLYKGGTDILKTDDDFEAQNIDGQSFSVNGTAGISATITTAQLTPGGAQGSMTFVNGILTAQTQAT